jgi:hypothetical protein
VRKKKKKNQQFFFKGFFVARGAKQQAPYNLVIVCTETKVVLAVNAREELKLSLGRHTGRKRQQSDNRQHQLKEERKIRIRNRLGLFFFFFFRDSTLNRE